MVAPDYQEFANRPDNRYPWQYRDLPAWHAQNRQNRTSVARLPRRWEHESGTFCPRTGKSRRRRSELGPASAV